MARLVPLAYVRDLQGLPAHLAKPLRGAPPRGTARPAAQLLSIDDDAGLGHAENEGALLDGVPSLMLFPGSGSSGIHVYSGSSGEGDFLSIDDLRSTVDRAYRAAFPDAAGTRSRGPLGAGAASASEVAASAEADVAKAVSGDLHWAIIGLPLTGVVVVMLVCSGWGKQALAWAAHGTAKDFPSRAS